MYSLKNGSRIRVQPISISGQSTQTEKINGTNLTSNIPTFAPFFYGDGLGLKGDYYNGSAFNSFAFTRVDSMIMFDQWSYDPKSSPTGVHYLITGDQFFIRWTGKIQPQFSESYFFYLQGSGGYRLWINDMTTPILDSWNEKGDTTILFQSSAITLQAGVQYDIKLEFFNTDARRGCLLYWQSASIPVISNIPQCQLYTDSTMGQLTAKADPLISLHYPTNKAVIKSIIDNSTGLPVTYSWIKENGPEEYTLINPQALTTVIKDLIIGTYVFNLTVTTVNKEYKANCKITVEVLPSTQANNLVITAYPNPSTTNFHLQLNSKSKSLISLAIFNNKGIQVFSNKNLNSEAFVTVGDNFERGAYYGIAEQDGIKQTINLMKL